MSSQNMRYRLIDQLFFYLTNTDHLVNIIILFDKYENDSEGSSTNRTILWYKY